MHQLMKWLSPAIFSLAYWLFRSSIFKRSPKKHSMIMKVFRFTADNECRKALSVYGHLLHFRGEGVQNRIQGAIYLQRAADKGEPKAQYQMGKIFEEGFEDYFKPSNDKAFHYYLASAEQGHVLAIAKLIDTYQNGRLGKEADERLLSQWQSRQPSLPTR
jgi:TPR repeat protein